jgi:hypothetical protein
LTLSLKYHQWVASLLLILYGFVTVPVQFWHHHPNRIAQLLNKKQSFHSTVSKDVIGKVHDCKICSHSYSIFAHDHARIEIGIAIEPVFLESAPVLNLLEFAGPAFSNKGPPLYFS